MFALSSRRISRTDLFPPTVNGKITDGLRRLIHSSTRYRIVPRDKRNLALSFSFTPARFSIAPRLFPSPGISVISTSDRVFSRQRAFPRESESKGKKGKKGKEGQRGRIRRCLSPAYVPSTYVRNSFLKIIVDDSSRLAYTRYVHDRAKIAAISTSRCPMSATNATTALRRIVSVLSIPACRTRRLLFANIPFRDTVTA